MDVIGMSRQLEATEVGVGRVKAPAAISIF